MNENESNDDKMNNNSSKINKGETNESDSNRVNNELLNKTYLYLNPNTNEVSKNPLTVSQLCRIISNTNTTATATATATATKPINENTYIIGYDIIKNEYDTSGWKQLKTIAILREVCINAWYYECRLDNGKNEVKGPIGIMEMSKLYFVSNDRITDDTRVWCSELPSFDDVKNNEKEKNNGSSEWKKLSELTPLILALEVFKPASSATMDNYNSNMMTMTYNESTPTSTDTNTNSTTEHQNLNKEEQAELEMFLSSVKTKDNEDDDEEEGFESDGGTSYIKDTSTGQWIPKSLSSINKATNIPSTLPTAAPAKPAPATNNNTDHKKRKRKKAQFAAKNARNWIYISNLPQNITKDEIYKYFSRAGVLDLDPDTQLPKIKLYYHKQGDLKGKLKGDASLCYAYPESVDIALQVLDETYIRCEDSNDKNCKPISVKHAKFEKKDDVVESKKNISNKKRQIAKLAARQAVDWDDIGQNGRIGGGRKGLRIIILKNMFHTSKETDFIKLEKEIYAKCATYGTVEKITICSKHADGIVIVKFKEPYSASNALDVYNKEGGTAIFWDGVTDYTTNSDTLNYEKQQKEEDERLDEFGDWLENQVIPEELLPRHE